MDLEKYYQVNPVVSLANEPDGAVLYNPDTDLASVVNPVGQVLWEFLAAPRTPKEMIDFLLDRYSKVSRGQAAEDIEQFIETLTPDFLLEPDGNQ